MMKLTQAYPFLVRNSMFIKPQVEFQILVA